MSCTKGFNISGLSRNDRIAVNRVAQDLGYEDVQHLITYNGCSSAKQFLRDFNFTNIRDFFLGYGWFERVEPFRKIDTTNKQLLKAG